MRKSIPLFLLLLAILHLSCTEKPGESSTSDKKLVIGYVPGFRGVLDELDIDACQAGCVIPCQAMGQSLSRVALQRCFLGLSPTAMQQDQRSFSG